MKSEDRKQNRYRLAALEAAFRLVYDILGESRYNAHGRQGVFLRIQAAVAMLASALCRCEQAPGEESRCDAARCLEQIRAEVERLHEAGALSRARLGEAKEAVAEIERYARLALGCTEGETS